MKFYLTFYSFPFRFFWFDFISQGGKKGRRTVLHARTFRNHMDLMGLYFINMSGDFDILDVRNVCLVAAYPSQLPINDFDIPLEHFNNPVGIIVCYWTKNIMFYMSTQNSIINHPPARLITHSLLFSTKVEKKTTDNNKLIIANNIIIAMMTIIT